MERKGLEERRGGEIRVGKGAGVEMRNTAPKRYILRGQDAYKKYIQIYNIVPDTLLYTNIYTFEIYRRKQSKEKLLINTESSEQGCARSQKRWRARKERKQKKEKEKEKERESEREGRKVGCVDMYSYYTNSSRSHVSPSYSSFRTTATKVCLCVPGHLLKYE